MGVRFSWEWAADIKAVWSCVSLSSPPSPLQLTQQNTQKPEIGIAWSSFLSFFCLSEKHISLMEQIKMQLPATWMYWGLKITSPKNSPTQHCYELHTNKSQKKEMSSFIEAVNERYDITWCTKVYSNSLWSIYFNFNELIRGSDVFDMQAIVVRHVYRSLLHKIKFAPSVFFSHIQQIFILSVNMYEVHLYLWMQSNIAALQLGLQLTSQSIYCLVFKISENCVKNICYTFPKCKITSLNALFCPIKPKNILFTII